MMFTVYQKLIWYQENRDRSSGKDQNWLITVYHKSVSVYIGFYCTFYRKKNSAATWNQKKIQYFPDRNKNPQTHRFLFHDYILLLRIKECLSWMGKQTLLSFDGFISKTMVFIFQELHLCFHVIDLCLAFSTRQCPSLLPAEWWNSLWWKRWPIKHRFHWWHNRMKGFFFPRLSPDPCLPPVMNLHWFPMRMQTSWHAVKDMIRGIIWLKQRRRFYCDPSASQSSVTTWSAARQLERRKKAIFIDQN